MQRLNPTCAQQSKSIHKPPLTAIQLRTHGSGEVSIEQRLIVLDLNRSSFIVQRIRCHLPRILVEMHDMGMAFGFLLGRKQGGSECAMSLDSTLTHVDDN